MLSAQTQSQLDGPALQPPNHAVPNFSDPENKRTLSLVVVILCLVIPSIATTIRAYVKVRLLREINIEDYFLLISWGFYLAFYVPTCMAIQYAPIVHQWDIQLKNLSRFMLYVHVGSIIYRIGLMWIKVALVTQFLRLFNPKGRKGFVFFSSHFILWTNVLFFTSLTFLEIFACSPRQKAWKGDLIPGKCIDIKRLNLASGIFNVTTDLMMLLLPQKVIWGLRLSLKQKLDFSAVFMIGIVQVSPIYLYILCLTSYHRACIFATLRLYFSVQLLQSQDTTYYIALMGLTAFPEMAAGLFLICLPVMPIFFRDIATRRSSFRRIFSLWVDKTHISRRQPSTRLAFPSTRIWSGNQPQHPGFRLPDQDRAELLHVNSQESNKQSSNNISSTSLPIEVQGAGIVRTVEIVTVQEPRREGDENLEFYNYYPWLAEPWSREEK
ncbi:hypothetical protein M501DRAFT_1054751 [Patellaria atrata CBS 101060]|uniref:Rhodopsin domain-containing protein n=1 Tax=Patellaria atrata CBS 101060 TaxID=1346257 RepID=A0A9P4VQK2_9PEZI|nr:hypothetical protein M501DRAFT_1054751 [Patellaria atrata CBS 101060]